MLTKNALKEICPEFDVEKAVDAALVLAHTDEFSGAGSIYMSKAEKAVLVAGRFSSLDNILAALLWEAPYALIVGAGFPADGIPDDAVALLRQRIFADLCILPDTAIVEMEHLKTSAALLHMYVERKRPLERDLLTSIPPEKALVGYTERVYFLWAELTVSQNNPL